MKVLVADDHPTNRNLLRMMLAALGHDVRLAENGAQACEQCALDQFDLLLLDLHMPLMSGSQVTTAVKAFERSPSRIVIVTADNSDESRSACLAAGADDVQTKPIDVAKLVGILTAAEDAASLRHTWRA